MRERHGLGCWWLVLIPVVLVALFCVQLIRPNPTIIVSPQTTHITEPLGPDGLPDYETCWIQNGLIGVNPENNAAIPIWQATWPGELGPEQYEVMCDALGMEIPSTEMRLVDVFDESVREQLNATLPGVGEYEAVTAEQLILIASHTAWTSEQLPVLAAWAESNETPLNLLVEGANRSRYYSPSPSFLDGRDDGLVMAILPGIHGLRNAARCLVVRSMWHVGEERPAEAWQDLKAAHLIARHASRGRFLVERLVGFAIERMACAGTQTLLHHGNLSSEQAAAISAELQALPDLPSVSTAIDEGERILFLDCAIRLATAKLSPSDLQNFGVENAGTVAAFVSSTIDWNIVLREGNQWYDRSAEAIRLPRAQRMIAMDQLRRDLRSLEELSNRPAALAQSMFSSRVRSHLVADAALALFFPALGAVTNASDHTAVQLELTRIAAALSAYRADHNQYPETLVALLPEYLEAMPMDIYCGSPFRYKPRDDGYVLYSVFENTLDDQGTDLTIGIEKGERIEEDQRARGPDRPDDLVVLVPRAKLPLSKSPE